MRGLDKDAVQDHSDAGSRVGHAAQEGPRTVYLNGGEVAECCLSAPQL